MYLIGDVPPAPPAWWMSHMKPSIRGLAMVKPGARLGDIGHAIQSYAEAQRCSCRARLLRPWGGQVFTTIPTSCTWPQRRRRDPEGRHVLHHRTDGESRQIPGELLFRRWTAVTRDKSLSAQCEHSIGVTETGAEVSRPRRRGCSGRLDHSAPPLGELARSD